jgi:hypothetical protein
MGRIVLIVWYFAASLLGAGLLLAGSSRDVAAADYMIINMQTNKCLTIAGGTSRENNVVAVQYICDAHPSRRWNVLGSGGVYQFRNLETGKCLTIAGGRSTDNNVRALQYNCDNDRSRYWSLYDGPGEGVFKVENLQTGKCLTIAGGRSTDNNVEALQYDCDDDRSRTWEIRRVTIID